MEHVIVKFLSILTVYKKVFSKSIEGRNKSVAMMRPFRDETHFKSSFYKARIKKKSSCYAPLANCLSLKKAIATKAARFSLPWWRSFFSSPASMQMLGKEFQETREQKGLSLAEIAKRLHFSEDLLRALEAGEGHKTKEASLFNPGYFRLAAVAYARFLDLDLRKINLLLPPPASLKSPHTTFIKKLSPLQSKPQKPHFMREKQQLTYSLKDVQLFLWKVFKIVTVLAIFIYLWEWMRHLYRVIF